MTHLHQVVEATAMFDVVLDFSGYEPKWIHDAAAVLKGKVGQATSYQPHKVSVNMFVVYVNLFCLVLACLCASS